MAIPRIPAAALVLVLVLAATPARAAESPGAKALVELKAWLGAPIEKRPPLGETAFAEVALSRDEAEKAGKLLWDDYAARIRETRATEMKAGEIVLGDKTMPFFMKAYGRKPERGHSLILSMHGGGNAPARLNDSQWENQKRLYQPDEGLYLAPRAPTNTWNLWHEPHIDAFFDRIIGNLVATGDVDPNRVYLMGYSAGGDGVYQLAPRMADRLAAAAMMAGHPNETSPLGLRNIGFAIHVGAEDGGYNRNAVAGEFGAKLDALRNADPGGYPHVVELHKGLGHWMNLEDKSALPWMAAFTRNPFPDRIVWKQDDVTHDRFYWLALPEGVARAGQEIVAARNGQTITIGKSTDCPKLVLRLHDALLDLDQPVTVVAGGRNVFEAKVGRRIATLHKTLAERGDPESLFPAEIVVGIPGDGAR